MGPWDPLNRRLCWFWSRFGRSGEEKSLCLCVRLEEEGTFLCELESNGEPGVARRYVNHNMHFAFFLRDLVKVTTVTEMEARAVYCWFMSSCHWDRWSPTPVRKLSEQRQEYAIVMDDPGRAFPSSDPWRSSVRWAGVRTSYCMLISNKAFGSELHDQDLAELRYCCFWCCCCLEKSCGGN
jgi:hypothetical protein